MWFPYILAIVFLLALGFALLCMAHNGSFYAASSMSFLLGGNHALDADPIACIDYPF
ncbi:nickel transporter NixA, partial [Helicobacter pylori]